MAAMEYDFVVIGGGHNGLIAANYLAKAGLAVLLVEKQPYLGGMAASQPYLSAAPKHLLSQGAIDSVFIKTTRIIEELDLAQHGLSLIPIDPGYGWIGADGETLGIFQDVSRTAAEISRFSKADARAYLDLQHAFSTLLKLQLPLFGKAATAIGPIDLVKAAMRVIGDRQVRTTLGRLVASSAHEAIATSFESDPIRSLYAYWCEIAGAADIDGSGLNLASLAVIHQVGCSRPIGSMGGLIAALTRSLKSRGGEVQVGTQVTEILVSQARAVGVRLESGEPIMARRGVLASCPPQTVYRQFLASEHQSSNSRERVRFLPANANNMCPFKLDLALSGPLAFTKAQSRRARLDGVDIGATSLMTGSFEDHLEHAAALRCGRMGKRPPTWMTVLSHSDSSVAPPGQSVAYLYTSAPSASATHWSDHAAHTADDLIRQASHHLEGLDAEIGRLITSPADFEQQYGAPRGCLYHVDMLPTRMMLSRPAVGMGGSASELAGLYLAGSGSHPGGGVFGMPGKLAAVAALQSV